jgi:hypothetical protein
MYSTTVSPMPERIQLRRTKGWRLQETSLALNGLPAVRVDRATLWGNPFKVGVDGNRPKCVSLFRQLLSNPRFELDANHRLFMFKRERLQADLGGKNLACWCPLPEPGQPDECHAAVLLQIANGPAVIGSAEQS